MQKPLSDDVFSQQTLKFCKSLYSSVGTKLFKIYPSVYNNFRHLCLFTRWVSSDFQRVQQCPASIHLHRRSSQVRNHSGAGNAGLPSSGQVRSIFFPRSKFRFNGLGLSLPWAKVQSFKTKIFLELDLELKMFVFRCGEETRIIPRILQVKAQAAGETE